VPNVTLAGRVQDRPPGEDTKDRLTVPVNPLTAVSVIVEVPEAPASIWAGDTAPAAIVKSRTVNVTVAEWDSAPLVPVTVTVYVPAGPEHDRVDVWDAPRTMLVGLRVHVKPAGETVDVNATVPVKPLTGATVIVEVAVAPARAVTLVGLAVTVKSAAAPTVTATVAEWESVPLVPVTVTVKVAAFVPVHDSVEVWAAPKTTLAGLRVHVRPAGETVAVRATVPVNPLTGVTVMVDDPEPPDAKLMLVGLAVTVKSRTVTVTVAEWVRAPLVPVTVTVKVVAVVPVQDSVDV